MQYAVGGSPLKPFAANALDGLGAPVRADVGEDGGRVGQQGSQQHRGAVQGIVLRGERDGLARPVPIEG